MVRWYDPRWSHVWEMVAATIVAGIVLLVWRLVTFFMGL